MNKYVESLYGAIFAQSGNSWLPEIPTGSISSRTTSRLLFPDSVYVNADIYAADLARFRIFELKIVPELACFGFDLAATFLRYTTLGLHGLDYLKLWFRNYFNLIWGVTTPSYIESFHGRVDPDDQYSEKYSGM